MEENINSIEKRIRQCLQNAGLVSLPESLEDDLIAYGMDSLIKAMSIIEIEREFKIRLKMEEFDANSLQNLNNFCQLISKV